ncbi:hypothetical protein A2480_01250 [Candidatus Uhrbacteria bacterium RIFOXYC2_FULL_47_19]|uniref:Release factor glutamine methyltransferase N-terminal domain-containing protein n=1 Tax=Candidatus Uhrbacteria bacterium RIFOXYC2_FULL_47_19 TaxID=1802424 RepID=A0A1F7WEJ4_9BACT|nr:MAG: hypothetical protein A2480_01250 [Candidatus Uhrbacteria bacterium RIFOXYC2_FULL_47_19]HCC22407.1 peptide chain release factor N(5)-glutamine methyltransferase [Candidatus Uhrbacteria bacterium]
MNLGEAYILTLSKLREHRCPGSDPERETADFLSWATSQSKETQLIHPEVLLLPDQESLLTEMIERRLRHEPLERITGQTNFLRRKFEISKDTLIPRPATEILVQAALKLINNNVPTDIWDIGTGSGCIAITMALESSIARVLATDTSELALQVARRNAEVNNIGGHVNFLLGELTDPLQQSWSIDVPLIILANLPYIPTDQLKNLIPDVRDFEPRTALDGGPDGLLIYRLLLDRLEALFLKGRPTSIRLFFEHLPEQFETLSSEITVRFTPTEITPITSNTNNDSKIGLTAKLF